MNRKCVYLDYNGTTPIYKPVLDAMYPYLTEHFGNPSSSHHYGVEPKRAVSAINHARLSFTLVLCTDKLKLDQARLSILRLVQCPHGDGAIDKDALMMTGCGTESNNWAIRSALLSARDRADGGLLHVVTSE